MEGDGRSRIPSLLRRSASVRVRGERHSVGGTCCSHPSADGDSVGSTASLVSCGSATSRPTGQTGVAASASSSGGPPRHRCRSVLHCQRPVETETYLTPTQRKDRELRQLRTALARANSEARVRDDRLRELAAQLQQLQIAQGIAPSTNGMAASDGHAAGGASSSSLGDSGISGDLLPSRVDSVLPEEPELPPGGNSPPPQLATDHTGLPDGQDLAECSESEDSTDSFPDEGGRRRSSSGADGSLRRKYRQLKHRYEQRTESLLQMLGDINAKPELTCKGHAQWRESGMRGPVVRPNVHGGPLVDRQAAPPPREQPPQSTARPADALWQHISTCQSTCVTRYLELRPAYESTQEKLRHLERELSEARAEIEKQERWHSEMYLKMYRKGQEAAQFERNEELQHHHRGQAAAAPAPPPAFVPGTERQAEYTLRFLKDAVFYFLTDRSDCRGHLSAIQSILGFSEAERAAVAKAWRHRGRL